MDAIEDMEPQMYVQYYRTWKQIGVDMAVRPPNNTSRVTMIWFHGPAGVGKSRKARELYPGAYDKPLTKWFDGYRKEQTVLIEDFDSEQTSLFALMKIWGDRFAFVMETKFGSGYIRPKLFIVTSQQSIAECFAKAPLVYAAIARRCDEIEVFNLGVKLPDGKLDPEQDVWFNGVLRPWGEEPVMLAHAPDSAEARRLAALDVPREVDGADDVEMPQVPRQPRADGADDEEKY